MSIWAIADIHASRRDPTTGLLTKPMDIFGQSWENHLSRLQRAWEDAVEPEDAVIVAGDIDWALHLEEAQETLAWLAELPGRKILLRGNHDYWWSSKTTNRVRRSLPPSLEILHNNALQAQSFNICGAKGSPVPGAIDWTDQDAKLLNREQQRLQLSLTARDPELPTIAALHYPPFYGNGGASPFRTMLEAAKVSCVVYGHLHGPAAASGPAGCLAGISYRLVAGDAVDFHPVLIARHGKLVEPCR